MTKITGRTYFPQVQMIRGLAALWVLLFHCASGHHIDHLLSAIPRWLTRAVFNEGHLGVPIFFALSGFVIAHSLKNVRHDVRDYCAFLARRSIRLDPPYWTSIALVICVGLVSHAATGKSYVVPSWSDIAFHMIYLQEIFGIKELNSVYWTLTIEIQFYIIYVVVFWGSGSLGRRSGNLSLYLWLVCLVAAIVVALGFGKGLPRSVFLTYWPAFFAGVLAYKALHTMLFRVAAFGLIGLMLYSSNDFFLASGATATFLFFTVRHDMRLKVTRWGLGERLGTISYSLYLTHNAITFLTSAALKRVSIGASVLGDSITLACVIIACLVVATIFWLLVERPSQDLSRRVVRFRRIEPA